MHAGALRYPSTTRSVVRDPEATMTPDDLDLTDSDPGARARELMQRGIAEARAGERIAAVASLKEAERVASDAGLTAIAIGAHINRGWALWLAGEAEGAIALYAEGAQMAREVGDVERLRLALGNLGIAYGQLGRHAESLAAYEEYLPFVSDDPEAGAEAHLNCGSALASLGRPGDAFTHFDRAQSLATDAGLTESVVMAHLNKGMLREVAGDRQAAFELYWKAFDIADETKDADLIGTVTMALGAGYARAGDDAHAGDCFEEAGRAFRASGDVRRLADALHGHEIALQRVGLDVAAMEALEEEESLRKAQGDDLALAACVLNQAVRLAARPKSPSADERFADAISLYTRAGALGAVAEAQHARAEWRRRQEMDTESLESIVQAVDAASQAGSTAVESRARALRAVILADARDLEAAEAEVEAAETTARETDDLEGITGARVRRAYIAARRGVPGDELCAQLRAAIEHARVAGHEPKGRFAAEAVAAEILERCGEDYRDALGEFLPQAEPAQAAETDEAP
jgi:tetratricopeptide (TPR) repeat protein